MTDLFADLSWRGLIHQTTDDEKLPGWLASGSRAVYAGFDPTADSLHVGHMVALMNLRRFQKAGHRPIALVGGATGMIGDPSGRSEERNLLSAEALNHNVACIEQQMRRFLDFESDSAPAELVNNYDWMKDYTYLAFLRDIGKNFPVNVMLAKDSVVRRLGRGEEGEGTGLSYTEFSYMLLQAYDFVHLNEKFNCELQIGGSDQWGNITAGIDLARRMRSKHLFGMTCPLLTKSDGTKMGKTADGAVWLSPERTSPYKFYQYWMNVNDDDVSKCLRFFTELSHEEIEALDASRAAEAHLRQSQKRLAEEITLLVHGQDGLDRAQTATKILFGGEISGLSDSDLGEIFDDVPSSTLSNERLAGDGLSLIEAFVAAGLAKSNGEARRFIQQGGAYVNNQRMEKVEALLTAEHLASETIIVLRQGKKKYALLRFQK